MTLQDSSLPHAYLMRRLGRSRVPVSAIVHPPEGNTVLASALRGHRIEDAAKSIVVRVKLSRKARQYVLAVVCGHRRVDLPRVAQSFGGIDARFADVATALELTGCVSGCVMPLSSNEALPVIADVEVLNRPMLWFNSGRLDHSVGLKTRDWLALAAPRIGVIAERDAAVESCRRAS